ncbi:3-carboxy-cis,cis-muconate cycloisomerase [Mesorhizobium sp. 10J20-29]
MAIVGFDHPFLSGLLGDDELSILLSADAELRTMIRFEVALAEAEAEHGVIPTAAADAIAAAAPTFKPAMEQFRQATGRDGVVVPELVRQLRLSVGEPHGQHIHFGATSQDVIDTALMLRLRSSLDLLDRRLDTVVGAFDALAEQLGGNTMQGHTRMQPALPITVADRIGSWRGPVIRERERLKEWLKSSCAIQFGGAAGTLDKFGGKAAEVRRSLASRLGLADAPQWHNQRDRVVELAGLLALVTGSLGKFGQDIALMAQDGTEIRLEGGGGSSAMPGKQNPVAAEMLVTLARFNAVQIGGMHQAMVHEQERSGAAWTLEWLLLPQMLAATGAATRHATGLLSCITTLGTANT